MKDKVKSIRKIWQCIKCKDIAISYSHQRHTMNWCECGESAVDLEKDYTRYQGGVETLSTKYFVNDVWISEKELEKRKISL